MDQVDAALPEHVVLLLGLPRSGTTLLTRMIGLHSAVDTIVEPYHVGRREGFNLTSLPEFAKAKGVALTGHRTLLVKETFQRPENISLSHALLTDAAKRGVNCVVIVILRSPIEAFLSQVEAAQTLWKDKSGLAATTQQAATYWSRMRSALHVGARTALGVTHRVVTYDALLADPRAEMQRLMSSIGYDAEEAQITLEGEKKITGGDPKAYTPGRGVSPDSRTDRSSEVAAFRSEMEKDATLASMLSFDNYIQKLRPGSPSDTEILTDIFLHYAPRS
jgi:hypothetical protein